MRILIASKEASFPHPIDDHVRDVRFWKHRWRGCLLKEAQGRGIGTQLIESGWAIWRDIGTILDRG